ncbi:MAG TPA: response regulator [Polyangiaceae bacterium]|nr:response regulator [Polyangiaceae bacterium]
MRNRILIVEDVEDIRSAMVELLTEELPGVTLGEASTAEEALAAVRSSRWDLLLLDLRLPQQSGFDLLPMLRELAPQAQVVVITCLPRYPYEHVVRQAGATAFMNKEDAFDELPALARSLLSDRGEGAGGHAKLELC